jgi:hypothetical protein
VKYQNVEILLEIFVCRVQVALVTLYAEQNLILFLAVPVLVREYVLFQIPLWMYALVPLVDKGFLHGIALGMFVTLQIVLTDRVLQEGSRALVMGYAILLRNV